jgi:hypothetical protein
MTNSDSRIARWSIRHPWWATGLWLAFVATTVVPGGMVETRQDAAARLAPLPEVAEAGEPVPSPSGVLEPVTVMASTQRRS